MPIVLHIHNGLSSLHWNKFIGRKAKWIQVFVIAKVQKVNYYQLMNFINFAITDCVPIYCRQLLGYTHMERHKDSLSRKNEYSSSSMTISYFTEQ